nr:spore wall protein 2-like [Tanacetum cinerariifolium]
MAENDGGAAINGHYGETLFTLPFCQKVAILALSWVRNVTEETVDEAQHDTIDSTDLTHLEEKVVRTYLDTLPDIETERELGIYCLKAY